MINNQWVWGCYNRIDDVVAEYADVDRILIDIPIGLSSKNFSRTVDAEARKYLTKRKSSIFSPPCRKAVYATDYKTALAINKEVTGKGISIQAYNISPKIKEIDIWLDSKPKHIEVFEAHPELCFKSLNENKDLESSKHEQNGIEHRQQLLFKSEIELKDIYENLLLRLQPI